MGRDPIFQRKILSLQYTVQRVFAVQPVDAAAGHVGCPAQQMPGHRHGQKQKRDDEQADERRADALQ